MKYRANRYPTRFKVVVMHNDRKLDCTMLDVSESGARLHNLSDVPVGDDVAVKSRFGTANGQVRWVKGGFCGIEFQPKVSNQMVGAFRKTAGHVHAHGRF